MLKPFQEEAGILYLAQMFMEKTDEEHWISLDEAAEYLDEREVHTDRDVLRESIESLQQFGFDIVCREGDNREYYMRSRRFNLEEIRILMDLVHSSGLLTTRRREVLLEKIGKLTSIYREEELKRQVMAAGRSGDLYQSMNAIYRAMDEDRQISFLYYDWILTEEKKLRRKGEHLTLSPWGILRKDQYYYMIAMDGRSGIVKNCRLDRIKDVIIEQELKRAGRDFFEKVDVADFAATAFEGIFGGKEEKVYLEFENRLLGKAVDIFGEDMEIVETKNRYFTACVQVQADREFFGWLTGAGTGVKIVGPENVCGDYRKFLKKVSGNYNR